MKVASGRIVVAGAIVLGAGSLLVAHPLGYDAWSWMVWAREVAHGNLATAGGPSFKALPVIVAAPFTPFGDAAPLMWLALARVSALLALVLAYRIGARLAGPIAGVTAAALLAAGPDLYRTALFGSSEPLLLVLVLGAAASVLDARPAAALALLGVGGLIRPELWPIVIGLAVLLVWRERRVAPAWVASAVLPPVIWLALEWWGSGNPLTQFVNFADAAGPCGRCAAVVITGTGVVTNLGDAIAWPALVLCVVAVTVAVRRRQREVLVLAGVAAAWIGIVAVSTHYGYPGSRRYLVGPTGVLAVLAGVGLVAALAPLRDARVRVAAAVAVAALLVVAAFPTVRESSRLVSVARAESRQVSQLPAAIRLSGGRDAVVARGRPAINPWRQSALAWRLSLPLAGVQATWHSTNRTPHWRPPAIVFRTAGRLAGPRPALGTRVIEHIGRVGAWEVLRADARANNA